MRYYLAYKRIPKERFYALKRSGDYDVFHVFNSQGLVCGLRLCTRFVIPVRESAYNSSTFHQQSVQLSLFDEYENQ